MSRSTQRYITFGSLGKNWLDVYKGITREEAIRERQISSLTCHLNARDYGADIVVGWPMISNMSQLSEHLYKEY